MKTPGFQFYILLFGAYQATPTVLNAPQPKPSPIERNHGELNSQGSPPLLSLVLVTTVTPAALATPASSLFELSSFSSVGENQATPELGVELEPVGPSYSPLGGVLLEGMDGSPIEAHLIHADFNHDGQEFIYELPGHTVVLLPDDTVGIFDNAGTQVAELADDVVTMPDGSKHRTAVSTAGENRLHIRSAAVGPVSRANPVLCAGGAYQTASHYARMFRPSHPLVMGGQVIGLILLYGGTVLACTPR